MSFTLTKIEKSGGSYEPIEAGKYDATLHALISLERQKYTWKGVDKVAAKVMLMYEVPEILRPSRDGVDLPLIMSNDATLSTSEKGNWMKIVSALTHKSMDEDELFEFINTEDSIKGLLGKACVLNITLKKNQKGDMRNYVDEVLELDIRLTQPLPVRTPILFTPAHPDLDVFRNVLVGWTRDKIMSAVNADEFPAELHKAYRDIKEQEAANGGNKLI